MAEKRKLQQEVEKTLRKVEEGLTIFGASYKKINSALPSASQRDKVEHELKREIKKLQRYRDQIKVWQASTDIKDKVPLEEARKKIEKEMERFKVCEREFKRKAYSREGLAAKAKLGPEEEVRSKHKKDLKKLITAFQTDLDTYETQIELINNKKSITKPDSEKEKTLKNYIERHNWHLDKLEQILRRLENDTIDMSLLGDVKECVELYIEQHEEPDFFDDEDMYTDLNLEQPEDLYVRPRKESEDLGSEMMEDDGGSEAPKPQSEKKAPPSCDSPTGFLSSVIGRKSGTEGDEVSRGTPKDGDPWGVGVKKGDECFEKVGEKRAEKSDNSAQKAERGAVGQLAPSELDPNGPNIEEKKNGEKNSEKNAEKKSAEKNEQISDLEKLGEKNAGKVLDRILDKNATKGVEKNGEKNGEKQAEKTRENTHKKQKNIQKVSVNIDNHYDRMTEKVAEIITVNKTENEVEDADSPRVEKNAGKKNKLTDNKNQHKIGEKQDAKLKQSEHATDKNDKTEKTEKIEKTQKNRKK